MFEWHKDKALLNLKKHNIDFLEASSVFDDYYAIYIRDPEHSINEERFVIIGYSENNKLLTVVFTERFHNKEKTIRIISARKSTKHERTQYEEKNKYN